MTVVELLVLLLLMVVVGRYADQLSWNAANYGLVEVLAIFHVCWCNKSGAMASLNLVQESSRLGNRRGHR